LSERFIDALQLFNIVTLDASLYNVILLDEFITVFVKDYPFLIIILLFSIILKLNILVVVLLLDELRILLFLMILFLNCIILNG